MNKTNNPILIRVIIYFVLLVFLCSVIFVVFKAEHYKENLENTELGMVSENRTLPTPDRIIYKNKNDEYMIIENTSSSEYVSIYSEFYNQITNIANGKIYSEEDIRKMQNRGSFVEFDYNTKSKNFIFLLEEENIGIIWRTSNGGQVIKKSLDNTNKLIKKLDKLTQKNSLKYYTFDTEENYTSENKLKEIPYNVFNFEKVENGVYQKVIDDNSYKDILVSLNFKTDKTLPNIDFLSQSSKKIIITISPYEIKNITQNIGNIKYEFGNFLNNEYVVNLLIVSNIVNSNCIYYNFDDLYNQNINTNQNMASDVNDDYSVSYYMENSKYYATLNNEKIAIISPDKACDLADEEAKKSEYQYQPWKSKFYSRGINKEYESDIELISSLSDISRLYHWNKDWKKIDYNTVSLMWKIRLFDETDPLTSLYIYIDATNGNIVGAGNSSD